MTTVLRVYNKALKHLGERRLTSATEDRPPRYHLDDEYSNVVACCGEEYDWSWCRTTVKISADPDIEPGWGYTKAHNAPSDLLKLSGVWSDELLTSPIKYYVWEGDNFYSSYDDIYVRYVPNDIESRIASWPQYFADYVSVELAVSIAPTLQNFTSIEKLERQKKKIKSNAKSLDSMRNPPSQFPQGSWANASLRGNRTYGPKGYNY